jgi:DNA-binding beta-propeller fold protein YncE
MKSISLCSLLALVLLVNHASGAPVVKAEEPIELEGTQGHFDFIKVDASRERLLAAHTQNGTLDVIDVSTSKLLKSVATGNAQGVALDDKNGLYYVSVSKPPKLVIVDSTKLEVLGEVPLPAPADLVAYDAKTNRVFVCNDVQPEMWIIDPTSKKILQTITLPGSGMEDLGLDSGTNFLFQNLKETSELLKIDPATGKVISHWSTLPAEKPHGLAILPNDTVLIAGGTGKLVLMSLSTGKITASAEITPRVDEIAFDPGLNRVYCAGGAGTMSILDVEADKLTPLESVSTPSGTHSVAVDPNTHKVWIVFAKGKQAFAEALDLVK